MTTAQLRKKFLTELFRTAAVTDITTRPNMSPMHAEDNASLPISEFASLSLSRMMTTAMASTWTLWLRPYRIL